MRVHHPHLALLALAATIAVAGAPPARGDWPHEPWVNVPVCTVSGDQTASVATTDDGGGTIVAWLDTRNGAGAPIIVAQRVLANGTPSWTAGGVAVCAAAGIPTSLRIARDGTGGCVISWAQDRGLGTASDIYAQRLNSSGVRQWQLNGVVVCNAAGAQVTPVLTTAYARPTLGICIAWSDARTDAGDIYVQALDASGTPQWTSNGLAVCTLSGYQFEPAIASGTAAGAGVVVAWTNNPSGTTYRLRAQKLNGVGTALWTANGVLLTSYTYPQRRPSICLDGASGAVIASQGVVTSSNDIGAQRVSSTGTLMWGDGVAVCGDPAAQTDPVVVQSGTSFTVAWQDQRGGKGTVYAQRLSASTGTAVWTINGIPLSTSAGDQTSFSATSSGSSLLAAWVETSGITSEIHAQLVGTGGSLDWGTNGATICSARGTRGGVALTSLGAGLGAIVAWDDGRSGLGRDVYAQAVDSWGTLGFVAPVLLAVRDVPGDQGGHVRLAWNACRLDREPNTIASYGVERRLPGSSTWDPVTTLPAVGFPTYGYVAATTMDSTGGANPRTSFRILANAASGAVWYSAADSGYSVDNLPPPAPGAFAVRRVDAGASLSWSASDAPDLALYRVEGSSTADFSAALTRVVAETAALEVVDANPAAWYRLVAVDRHGNASAPVRAAFDGPTSAPAVDPSARAWLEPPVPNPAHDALDVRFMLPRDATARLALFDATGRRVRSLVEGRLPAGTHVLRWNGRDDAGRILPSALYLVRLDVEGRTLVRKAMWIH